MFIKDQVNAINTPTWIRVNEDAQRQHYRNQFVNEYGGRFIQNGRYVTWDNTDDISHITDRYVIKTPDNKIELTEVFSVYCKENNLNKAAMYATLRGVRNHHKKYKLIKIPE
jgi:hypothetical protein